mmetsp:Transcript_48392/g.115069  ORF Transcript_48392/g.115069 Transcript_48392/m.115069 type:complete len:242 (+) Transcript_48392:125-850(+)
MPSARWTGLPDGLEQAIHQYMLVSAPLLSFGGASAAASADSVDSADAKSDEACMRVSASVPAARSLGARTTWGRMGSTSSLQTAHTCSMSLSSSSSSLPKSLRPRHSGHCQSEQKGRSPHRLTSSSEITAWSDIHATCLGQQPVPLTLQLRTSWFMQLPRVLLGVAANAIDRGCPSLITAVQALAKRLLRRARFWAGFDIVLAARGAGPGGQGATAGSCGGGLAATSGVEVRLPSPRGGET